jgi:nicotinate phosphoribosyltransferase
MQIISECYFRIIDTNWNFNTPICQVKQINEKCRKLAEAGCSFVEGGSRRRRSYYTQEAIVGECKHYTNFIGTSNVHFARLMNVKAIGTMAHQWIMGVSVLQGLRHANQLALREWLKVYNADLGIALSDTYGSDAFYEDFDKQLTKTFDGVRHDSGDPIEFAKKTISHYAKLKIDPRSKTIVFSDGLDADTAIKINEWCKGKIKCSFLIGTNFTNDFLNHDGVKSKPLNMVIKLRTCDGVDVVKLSDVPGKATGDEDAVRVAKWTFFNTPLDS